MPRTKDFGKPPPEKREIVTAADLSKSAGERFSEKVAEYREENPQTSKFYQPFYVVKQQRLFTLPKKEIYVFTLAELGNKTAAANGAGVSTSTVLSHRNKNSAVYDPDFDAACEEAEREYNASVEREIHERALNGWQEPVFGGREKDRIVGHVTKKSERLLTTLAKRRMPEEYGDKVAVTQKGGGAAGGSSTEIAPGVDIANLTPDQRRKLRDFLTAMDGVDRSEVIDAEVIED